MGNNVPDVRVRLSAEGVQEVVAAFRRIQQEAQRTAQQSKLAGEAHGLLTKQLESMKELLPTLAAGAIMAGFLELAESGRELADNLGKLKQKTGLAAETISTLSFAARYADVEQEKLAKGLVFFTRTMDDYDKGAEKVAGAVRRLFGSEKALKGLDTDQRLQKVIEKLAGMEEGAKRTGAASDLFGKKLGADLLPLIDEVGTEGFDALRKKAEALGLTINEKTVAAAEALQRSMITLKAEAQGMAMQFLMGLAPELANVTDAITEATSDGAVNGFKTTGEVAGKVIAGIAAAFLIVGKTIGFVISEGVQMFSHFGEYVKDTLKGTWDLIKAYAQGGAVGVGIAMALKKPGENAFMDRLKAFADDVDKSVSALFKDTPTTHKKKRDASTSTAEDDGKAARAALELAQAQADAKVKILTAQQRQEEAAEKERYEKGLESLKQYYAERIATAEKLGQAEVDAAQLKVNALTNAPLSKGELRDDRQAKIVAAQADVDAKRIDVQTQINGLRAEEAKETEALQQKALDFEKRISQAQGNRFMMAKAEIDAEANALDNLLKKQGVAVDERQRRVSAFQQAGYQQVDFAQLQHQASMAMNELDRQRQEINQRVQGGQLFAFQGEQQKMALEQQELPLLRQIADEMQRSAFTPEQRQSARDFAMQVDELAVNSNKAALRMAELKLGAEQAMTGELSSFFSSGIDQCEGYADAFRSMALSVAQSLRQISSQMLSTLLVQKMLGLFGLAMPGASATAVVKKAGGGLVLGPGTGTSDSIPARLSNGEYVVREAAVRRIGVEALDAINYGTPRTRRRGSYRFADGGLVDVPQGGAKVAGMMATLQLDRGLLLKDLEADPEFHRLHVRMTAKNQKAMRQAMGS